VRRRFAADRSGGIGTSKDGTATISLAPLGAPFTSVRAHTLGSAKGSRTIIPRIDDPPPGLEELRAVLLRKHVGRVRDGLD